MTKQRINEREREREGAQQRLLLYYTVMTKNIRRKKKKEKKMDKAKKLEQTVHIKNLL